MPLNLSVPAVTELKPKISVIGVGGAGGNAVNNMIESQLEGVDFVVANTDAQAVGLSLADHKIQLGTNVTKGLGAGSQPQIGEAAAEESLAEVMDIISGSNMLFITAGMGGGTGTGAAPVIARAARERGILTVGVITKPFHFEGARRMRIADDGIVELQKYVDTLLIIPNQNLFRVADDNTTFADAFAMADEVLHSGVRGITDLMIVPGLINLDFADVRSVMSEMGKAMMGTGEADGDKRAAEAAEAAISNPLLDEVSMKGARGVLINITGGMDMKLFEVDEAANRIRSEVDPDANIIVGSTFSHELDGKMRVSVVATGIDADEELQPVAPAAAVENPPADKPWLGAIARTSAPTASAVPTPHAVTFASAPQEVETASAEPELFSAPIEPEATVVQPEAVRKPMITRPEPVRSTETTNKDDDNPVGEVHARIRKMLTEDQPVSVTRGDLKAGLSDEAPRNPFREEQKQVNRSSPLNAAMGLLRETFGTQSPGEQGQGERSRRNAPSSPRKPAGNLFESDDGQEMEIPSFLRKKTR